MNILYLTTHLSAGGITSYLYLLGKKLCRDGHNVFVVSGGGEVVPTFIEAGINHKTMNIRTKSELDPRIYIAALQLKDFIRENKIDIIHANTRITQVMGQLLGWWTKCKYLSTCHGYFKTRLIRRIAPCWGDAVIAISSAVVEHLKKDFHVDESNICMLHNGINIDKFPLIDDKKRVAQRKEYKLNGAGPFVGIIARLSDVKGHDILIRAMLKIVKDFPTAQLLLVGQGREEVRLKRLVQQVGIADHVMFIPSVGRPMDILPLFDVFVLPSYKEGLALSLIEAQASGLPVVATRVGGIPEVVLNERTGLLVEPGDVDGLAEAILRLLKNKEFAVGLGAQAHKFVASKFTADLMAEKTMELYKRLLGLS